MIAGLAWLAAGDAAADVLRNPPWNLPPPGVPPSITVTYLASGGNGIACYGGPASHAVGNRDTWWCFSPGNELVGYLHAERAEFKLYYRNMALRCRFFYTSQVEQPSALPPRTQGWNGRGECAREGPYTIAVRWAE
jgi:hypothetical protein